MFVWGEVLLGGLIYFVLGYDPLSGGGEVCWELLRVVVSCDWRLSVVYNKVLFK